MVDLRYTIYDISILETNTLALIAAVSPDLEKHGGSRSFC